MVVSTNKGRWCACSSRWTESRETAGTRKLGPGISCSPPCHVPESTPVRPSYSDDVFLLEATLWKLFQTCGECLWLKAFSHSPIENSHRSVDWTSSYDCLEMDQCTLRKAYVFACKWCDSSYTHTTVCRLISEDNFWFWFSSFTFLSESGIKDRTSGLLDNYLGSIF